MKFSILTYAVSLSVVCHLGLAASSASINWFNFSKPSSLSKPIEKEPLEIVHFYSVKSDFVESDQMPPMALNQKGYVTEKVFSNPDITDDLTYAAYVRDLIVSYLSYPKDEPKDREAQVQVLFVLHRDGSLKELSVADKSNEQLSSFDRAALKAVRSAAAYFPIFPETVQKKDQRFSFLLVFDPLL